MNAKKVLKQAVLIGTGFFGTGSIIYGAIELVRANPDKGFQLLEKWGPWYFLAMFGVWVLYMLVMRLMEVLTNIGERFAGAMDRIADEQVKLAAAGRDQADAMQRSADRDDRDAERMATLVEYAGQQSRETREAVVLQGETLARIAAALNDLNSKGNG